MKGLLTKGLKQTLKRGKWMGDEECSLDWGIRGGRDSKEEERDGILGCLKMTWPLQPETEGGGGWEALLIWESSPQSLEQV